MDNRLARVLRWERVMLRVRHATRNLSDHQLAIRCSRLQRRWNRYQRRHTWDVLHGVYAEQHRRCCTHLLSISSPCPSSSASPHPPGGPPQSPPFFAAQTPEWRAFFQTHRPWTDIGVAAICFFALKLPSKRPGAWSPC